MFRFPEAARGLNGSCLLAPSVVLISDCFAGLIWRLDVQPGGCTMQARVWLARETMNHFPGKLKPEQPGVNGVRHAAKTNCLFYTETAKKLLMRVPVDPMTIEPAGAAKPCHEWWRATVRTWWRRSSWRQLRPRRCPRTSPSLR